jgi:hypothetical protein
MPWASIEDAISMANIEDLLPREINTLLDLERSSKRRVETLDEAQLAEYFSEFLPTTNVFKMQGGPEECFREYARFFELWMLLNLNNYMVPKVRESFLVAEWESWRID